MMSDDVADGPLTPATPAMPPGSAPSDSAELSSLPASASLPTPASLSQPVPDTAAVRGALEAILMVTPEPVSTRALATAIGATEAHVDTLLRALAREYESGPAPRGFQLREVAGGWRFYSHPRYATEVAAFVTAGQSNKLSVQALETLAVVAYKQPVTKAQVAAIRGVDVDSVLRTLETRGLIQRMGATAATGAALYGTTELFLERMGMNSLSELAPLAPYLPDDAQLEEIESELP